MKRIIIISFIFLNITMWTAANVVSESNYKINEASDSDLEQCSNNEKNKWDAKLIKSPFGLGIDIQTKYVWRGMEMMTEDAAPVLFPSLNYSWNNLYVYTMGGYAINGKYAEVDLGINYTCDNVTFGINDYYYPSIDNNRDKYLGLSGNTGHWLEASISYAPVKIPFWATLSNFFYGADKYIDRNGKEKQAYSTYMEIGTYYDFIYNNRLALAIGAAFNKSCYNGYEHDFSICNVELKYTYNVEIKKDWSFPLSVSYIYNPVYDKSYVNFVANFTF